jgi:hypothetical protein
LKKRQAGSVGFVVWAAGSTVSQKSPPTIVHVSNPTAFSGRGSVIILELADEDAARKVAHKIADETGRCVTVRDADMVLLETIPAAQTH